MPLMMMSTGVSCGAIVLRTSEGSYAFPWIMVRCWAIVSAETCCAFRLVVSLLELRARAVHV